MADEWSEEDGHDALPYGPYDGRLPSRLPAEGSWIPLRLDFIEIREPLGVFTLDLRAKPTVRRFSHRRPYTIQSVSWSCPKELRFERLLGKVFLGRVVHRFTEAGHAWDSIDGVQGLPDLEMKVKPVLL